MDSNEYDLKYIYHCLLNDNSLIQNYFRGSGVQHPDMKKILQIKIPIPPIELQKEIAIILDVNSITICRFLKSKNISSEEIKSRSARFRKRNEEKKIYQYDFEGKLMNIYSSASASRNRPYTLHRP